MASLLPGLSLLVSPKTLFAKATALRVKWGIQHHCPGGAVDISLQDFNESQNLTARLDVRLGAEAPTTVSQARVLAGRCSLTLDLPTAEWRPGIYEVRAQIQSSEDAVLWESSWTHAFSLRPWPWAG